MIELSVKTPLKTYPVYIGIGAVQQLPDVVKGQFILTLQKYLLLQMRQLASFICRLFLNLFQIFRLKRY